MRKQEFIINLLLILFSISMIFMVIPKWVTPPETYGLWGGTLPTACCVIITILASFQILSGIMKGGLKPDGKKGMNKEVFVHMLTYFVPMFCIVPLWYYWGFLAGSIPVLFILLLVAGRRDIKVIGTISILLPVIIMLLLRYGLKVPTP